MKPDRVFNTVVFAAFIAPAAMTLATGSPWWLAFYVVFGLIALAAG